MSLLSARPRQGHALALWPLLFCGTALSCGVPKEQHAKIVGDLKRELEDTQRGLTGKTTEAANLADKLGKCRADVKGLESQLATAKGDFENAKRNHKECLALVRGEAGKVASLAQEVRDKEAEIAKRLEELKRKGDEIATKEAAIKALQAQVDRLRAIFTDLEQKLDSLVKSGKLIVKMRQGLLIVQLPERILFPSGSARLKNEGKEAVVSVTEILKAMKHRWQVAGHTDDVGSPKLNWRLSVQRARAVLYVMLQAGMPPEQISTAGFGPYLPVAPNDTPENRAMNRRTELLLVPDLSELLSPIRPTVPSTGARL
jgi:chemotaxis protein MotB